MAVKYDKLFKILKKTELRILSYNELLDSAAIL